jgi:hypothetical protein
MRIIFAITCRCENDTHKSDIVSLVHSILRLHSDGEKIVVVDSSSPDKSYFEEIADPRVIIHDINNTNYELGTIKFVYTNYNADKYIFLQDSIQVKDSLKEYYRDDLRLVNFNRSNMRVVSDWYGCNRHHIAWVKNCIPKTNLGPIPKSFELVFACSFLVSRALLQHLYENGLKDIEVRDKIGSCGMERVLGIGLYNYGIKNFENKLFDINKVEKIWRGRL